MKGDPRLGPIEALSDRDVPRAWITASRPLHRPLIEAITEHAPANLVFSGDRTVENVVGDAGVDALHDHVRDTGAWCVIVEPGDTDVLRAELPLDDPAVPVVVISSDPDDALGTALLDSHLFVEPWYDPDHTERWVAERLGRQPSDSVINEVLALAAGSAHLVALMTDALVRAEVQLPGAADTVVPSEAAGVAEFTAAALDDLEPATAAELRLAALTGTPVERGRRVAAFAAGLAGSDGSVFPAVAEAIRKKLTDTAMRDASDDIAAALDSGRLDESEATGGFLAVGRVPPTARPSVLASADRWLAHDPQRALSALELIPEMREALELRMRALALTGRMTDAAVVADRLLAEGSSPHAGLVTAAGLAAAARFSVAARSYESADPEDELRIGAGRLSAPVRATIGERPELGGEDVGSVTAAAITQYAQGSAGIVDGSPGSMAMLRDGAELAAKADTTLWPDTPHTFAVTTLTMGFDHEAAYRLLGHAGEFDVGGAAHRNRHRLLGGWVALRRGEWATAEGVIAEMSGQALSLRDRLSLIGLQVGLARRSGDINDLESTLGDAVDLVQRHPVDLVSLVAHTEIAIAVGRMGAVGRSDGLLGQLESFAEGLAHDPWRDHVLWTRVVAGILTSQPSWVASVADHLENETLRLAARIAATPGEVDVQEIVSSCELLVSIGQIHEASLIAAAGALGRSVAEARPLVTFATQLRAQLPGRGREAASGLSALSDRELEVARELIDGRRYKEIGERLFISAKTVEHHVAHIKTKLGASTRSEMISALRQELG